MGLKAKATIKFTLKSLAIQWKQVLLMFAIFPLILALIMGYFQKDVFKPNVSIDKINITIIDKDKSKSSQGFKELFKAGEMKKLFNLSQKGKYIITIPKGYENNLARFKNSTIKVQEKERISRANEIIIKTIIKQYGKSLTESMIISKKVNRFPQIKPVNVLKTHILNTQRTLTALENQAACMMSFVLFMIILGCVAAYHLDKENGTFKRLISTPISKQTFFNLDLLIFFITSLIYGLIYIVTFRVAGIAFKGVNPINIGAILVSQSILLASLAGLLVAFFGKNKANTVIIILMYVQIIFGNGFIPVKEVTNKIFVFLSQFAPGNVITQAYKNCMLFNSFYSIEKYLITMIVVAIAAYAISLIKVRVRWEE